VLKVVVPLSEAINDKNEFVIEDSFTLEMEHSLASLSKWESNFEKPFLTTDKTPEQIFWYVKAMTLTQDVPDDVFEKLSKENAETINNYIGAKMTATTFPEERSSKENPEIITAELIYYWMISFNVPSEYQYWHLNRLLTLIQVCSRKNAPPKKMKPIDVMRQNADLNARRRAESGSSG
jgi:hypothetical protein